MSDATVTIGGDVSDLQRKLKEAGGNIQSFGKKAKKDTDGVFSKLLGGVGGMLPALGVSAVVGGIHSILGEMDDLADAAIRLGESTESIQRIEHASKILAGVDINGVTSSFERFERALGDIENEKASAALANLGLTAESLSRMPLEEKILALADAYDKAKTNGTNLNDIVALLGKSAGSLIPLLEAGRDGIQEMFNGAAVVGDASVQQLAAMNDELDAMVYKSKAGFGSMVANASSFLKVLKGIASGKRMETIMTEISDADKSGEAEIKREQDRADKAEARAAALKQATADKAADEEKKRRATLQKGAEDRAKAVEAIAEQANRLGEREFKRLLQNMSAKNQVAALEKRITGEKERQQQVTDANQGILSEEEEIENKNRLLDLYDELGEAQRQLAAEKEKADLKSQQADEEKLEAADEENRMWSEKLNLARQMAILEAKAAGDDEEVKKLERVVELDQRIQQIAEATGLSKEEAAKMAEKMLALEEQIAEQEQEKNRGGRKKIKGYSREKQGEDGTTVYRGLDDQGRAGDERTDWDRMQEGESAWDRLQGGDSAWDRLQKKVGGGEPRQNPAAVMAAKNAVAQEGGTKTLETKIDETNKILTTGLLSE